MRRIHLFEFHDRDWFPAFLRDQVTDALQVIFDFLRIYAPVAPLLGKALKEAKARQVLDLCSGAGGPWFWLQPLTHGAEGSPIHVCLTDKYPNSPASHRAALLSTEHLRYFPDPVDVMGIPPQLGGFRTLFTAFHHFRPAQARALLEDAVKSRQGIAIFEVPNRHPLTLLLVFLVPVADWLLTPFIRPFRWSRLFWTYVCPVVPAVLWFDGMVSCLRAYSPGELRELTHALTAGGYTWQVGEKRSGALQLPITYLIGYPTP